MTNSNISVIPYDISSQIIYPENFSILKKYWDNQMICIGTLELGGDNSSTELIIRNVAMLAKSFGLWNDSVSDEDICYDTRELIESMLIDIVLEKKLNMQLDSLAHILIEMESNIVCPSIGIRKWFTVQSSVILGGVFGYYDSNLYFPSHVGGEMIIIGGPQLRWMGKTFVYMQGIGANIYFILAKMAFHSALFPFINDYLPNAIINFAYEMKVDFILVNPIGIQKSVLLKKGFKAIESINVDIAFTSECLPASAGVTYETVYYELL